MNSFSAPILSYLDPGDDVGRLKAEVRHTSYAGDSVSSGPQESPLWRALSVVIKWQHLALPSMEMAATSLRCQHQGLSVAMTPSHSLY